MPITNSTGPMLDGGAQNRHPHNGLSIQSCTHRPVVHVRDFNIAPLWVPAVLQIWTLSSHIIHPNTVPTSLDVGKGHQMID